MLKYDHGYYCPDSTHQGTEESTFVFVAIDLNVFSQAPLQSIKRSIDLHPTFIIRLLGIYEPQISR